VNANANANANTYRYQVTMPRQMRQNSSRISHQPNPSQQPNPTPIPTENDRYVTIEAFNALLQELGALRSIVQGNGQGQGQTVNNDGANVSNDTLSNSSPNDTSSSSSTVVSDFGNGIIKSIYDNIPQYSGDGDIQKLLDFSDKVDDYLAIANHNSPTVETTLITMKLTGTASLMWRHHKRLHDASSPNRIQTWKGLRELLMQNKVTKEQERYILTQLDSHKQKDSVQRYTNEFERYTMQLIDLPLTIEMHYYLKGLKVEIRQLVESNELNLTCMATLKNACLRQDQIMSPPPGNDKSNPKANDESIALTASNTRGKRNNRGGYSRRGSPTSRGGYNANKGRENDNYDTDDKNSGIRKPRYTPRSTSYKGKKTTNSRCYACSENGHTTRECPAVKDAIERCRKDKNKTASTSSVRTMHVSTNSTTQRNHPKLRFLIDSGTTQHMTPHKEILENITASSKQILTAGNYMLNATGEGDTIVMNDLRLTNVLLAPELQDSLLSIAAINDHGYTVTFNCDGVVIIKDGNVTIAEGYREGNLYYLQLQSQTSLEEENTRMESQLESSYTLNIDNMPMSDYKLWHLRLGHLGTQSLLKMPTLVQGMAKIFPEQQICEGCIYGKQCRKPFTESKTQRILMELVHSDILGPIKVPSLNKARYVLIFIEHRSRYPKCYFLRNKSAETILKHFKEYKAWAENITGQKIKILRTDGGGEYINLQMTAFLKENGIEHQHTVPYTPQQNGIAERFNRTVIERTRAILHGQHLPSKLWAEILDAIRYLYTIGPIRALKDSTPDMVFRSTPESSSTSHQVSLPNIEHLRILGCVAYTHINKQLRTKLDPKSIKCIHVGYGDDCKAYRIWNPKTDKVFYSRDVIFDETQFGFTDADGEDKHLLDDNDDHSVNELPLDDDDDQEYHIEYIAKECTLNNGLREFHVKWHGYSESDNTWEPYDNLINTHALDEWEKRNITSAYTTEVDQSYLQTDPLNLRDAMSRPDRDLWIDAMNDEIKSL
jgi:hypothetical protein